MSTVERNEMPRLVKAIIPVELLRNKKRSADLISDHRLVITENQFDRVSPSN